MDDDLLLHNIHYQITTRHSTTPVATVFEKSCFSFVTCPKVLHSSNLYGFHRSVINASFPFKTIEMVRECSSEIAYNLKFLN